MTINDVVLDENPMEVEVGVTVALVANQAENPDENLRVRGSSPLALTNFSPTETPPILANRMVDLARISEQSRVLEPSAGWGNLAQAARNTGADVTCIELNSERIRHLREEKFVAWQGDFLHFKPGPTLAFDAVVMCPPRNAIAHIDHALKFLKPDGVLVALIRADSKNIEKYLDKYNPLVDITFTMNGESVPSGLVIIDGN